MFRDHAILSHKAEKDTFVSATENHNAHQRERVFSRNVYRNGHNYMRAFVVTSSTPDVGQRV